MLSQESPLITASVMWATEAADANLETKTGGGVKGRGGRGRCDLFVCVPLRTRCLLDTRGVRKGVSAYPHQHTTLTRRPPHPVRSPFIFTKMKVVKLCSVDQCKTKEYQRGLCHPHYQGTCSADGCNSTAAARGVCKKHDTKPKVACCVEGCGTKAAARGRCKKHGAYGFCSTAGCNTAAVARGVCKKHGAHGFCSFDNCTTAVSARGRCDKHGGGTSRKMCEMHGCSTASVARGVCGKHGPYGTCQVDECTTNAQSGSKHCCRKHGGGNKPCFVAGCTTVSERRGLCCRHGGSKSKCWIAECTSKAVSNLKLCCKHGRYGFCAHPSGCSMPALKTGSNYCRRHSDTSK